MKKLKDILIEAGYFMLVVLMFFWLALLFIYVETAMTASEFLAMTLAVVFVGCVLGIILMLAGKE